MLPVSSTFYQFASALYSLLFLNVGTQFWSIAALSNFQQTPTFPNMLQQAPNVANSFLQQTSMPTNYETVSNMPATTTTPFGDLPESREAIEAAYKGLTYYTGDQVDPKFRSKFRPYPAGYPVSLDIDKENEPPTRPPATTTTQKPSDKGVNRGQLVVSYAKLQYGDQSASSKISAFPDRLFEKPSDVNKIGAEKPPDIPLNKLGLAFNFPKKTTATTTTTSTPSTTTTSTSTTATPKKECPFCKNKDKGRENKDSTKDKNDRTKDNRDKELPDGTMCYLPRIVVNTRLMGTTVINEIKIYTSPRDENSVHRFVTSHEVSDAASKISHEFILPPQFITQKELSAADLKYMNNTPVMITSAYAETSHQHMQIPVNMLTQYPMNADPEEVTPTFNPYLPTTTKQATTTTKQTTTTVSTVTSTTPTTKPTTTTTITTATTSATPETTTATTSTTSTQNPNIKKRHLIETLNYKARHRNALLDVPGGDSFGKTSIYIQSAYQHIYFDKKNFLKKIYKSLYKN